jgi:hypothetical protein
MNVWLIGGGAYLAVLGFALALCRVASPQSRRQDESMVLVDDSAGPLGEWDQLVDPGLGWDGLGLDAGSADGSFGVGSGTRPATRPSQITSARGPRSARSSPGSGNRAASQASTQRR